MQAARGPAVWRGADQDARDGVVPIAAEESDELVRAPSPWVGRSLDGVTRRLLTDTQLGGLPNGITLSADEKYLYLSAGTKMMRYPVKADDTLGAGSLFTQGPGIGDGMRSDSRGNIYSTGGGPALVRVTSPAGKFLGTIDLPIVGGEPKKQVCATNVAFGDNDARTLYIAACDFVYKVRLKVPGVIQGPRR